MSAVQSPPESETRISQSGVYGKAVGIHHRLKVAAAATDRAIAEWPSGAPEAVLSDVIAPLDTLLQDATLQAEFLVDAIDDLAARQTQQDALTTIQEVIGDKGAALGEILRRMASSNADAFKMLADLGKHWLHCNVKTRAVVNETARRLAAGEAPEASDSPESPTIKLAKAEPAAPESESQPDYPARELLHLLVDGLRMAENDLDGMASILAERLQQGDGDLPRGITEAAERVIVEVSTSIEKLKGHAEALFDRELDATVPASLRMGGGPAAAKVPVPGRLSEYAINLRDRAKAAETLLRHVDETTIPEDDTIFEDAIRPAMAVLVDLVADADNLWDEICGLGRDIDEARALEVARRLVGSDADLLVRLVERVANAGSGFQKQASSLFDAWFGIEGDEGRDRAIKAVETIAKAIPGVKA